MPNGGRIRADEEEEEEEYYFVCYGTWLACTMSVDINIPLLTQALLRQRIVCLYR